MESDTCDSELSLRQALAQKKSIVIKVGTNVVLNPDGSLAEDIFSGLVEQAAALQKSGRDVVLVSSGAVGLGAHRLGLPDREPRAVCAAAGQCLLTSHYHQAFARHGIPIAQILVTADDFLDPTQAAGLRETILHMQRLGVLPLLNENDAVTQHGGCSPIRLFGDNDQLAALVAKALDSKLLILLTDVEGLYTLDPSHSSAELIAELRAVTQQHMDNAGVCGPRGRGGMKSKLLAIERALADPVLIAVIANGRRPRVLEQILAGEEVGTLFSARG